MLSKRTWARLFSWISATFIAVSSYAIEVTEPAGAAHGYPGLCDISGKKLADGEFRQWVGDHHLYVVITYRFPKSQLVEEKARFRQDRELTQEHWSWKQLEHGRPQREFSADFTSGITSAHIRKDNKDVTEKIDVEPGRTFAGFGFTIALSNLRKKLLKGEQIESVFRQFQRSSRKL